LEKQHLKPIWALQLLFVFLCACRPCCSTGKTLQQEKGNTLIFFLKKHSKTMFSVFFDVNHAVLFLKNDAVVDMLPSSSFKAVLAFSKDLT
jgi:hypothetical protein